ncbi:MAG TPA: hydrogen gas-evolving membrane-bound hydrogenase subunit E [Dysgonamonadaceae bacterium]|nr:hydrogen gas-evolving membrane-bound hydrogenase subunit E [Dysgonamonadaceae bacterium]
MEFLIIVLISFSGALLSSLLFKLFPKKAGLLMTAIPLFLFSWASIKMWSIIDGAVFQDTVTWVESFNFDLVFRLDGLSVFFLMLITGFGVFIHVYANSYLAHDKNRPRFFVFLSLFMGAMVGLVMSGSLLLMFVFWELTSLSSYFLIGYYHDKEKSRDSALQAMLVTVMGGLFMLAGIILIGQETGTFQFDELMSNPNLLLQSPKANIILILLAIGAFTKSAQFPFHFWLPNAMEAPAPVSAYLHSTTMVKAGIFLLARISPIFIGFPLWHVLLPAIGGFTMVFGAVKAIMHTDLKKILAYTTVSALGIMVMLLGIGTTIAVQAAMVFVLAHALYKGTLFMVVGNIEHETGARHVNELSGLRNKMPLTYVAAALASMSMAGLIPFFGFVAKELLYTATAQSPMWSYLTLSATFVASVLFAALSIEIGYKVFFGKEAKTPKQPHETSPSMLFGPLVASFLGLIGGVFATQLVQPLLHQASNVALKVDGVLDLTLWHGFTLIFGLSLLTLVAGWGVYLIRHKIRGFANRFNLNNSFGPEAIYNQSIPGLLRVSSAQTRFFQSGFLRNYLITIALFFVGLVFLVVSFGNFDVSFTDLFHSSVGFRLHELLVIVIMLIALWVLVNSKSRLTVIVSMGLVGYSTALIYLFFGAPDVAMTQFLIETLSVVLFVLVLNRLPLFVDISRTMAVKRFVPALLFGLTMSFLLLWVQQTEINPALKEYFVQNSFLQAQGRNIVNVILVDFRGLDTMGEITVLMVASLGVYSLLKIGRKGKSSQSEEKEELETKEKLEK